MTIWSYEGYWNAVLGANRSAEDVVTEFALDLSDRDGLSNWLGEAEYAAQAAGNLGARPESWDEYHVRALDSLCGLEYRVNDMTFAAWLIAAGRDDSASESDLRLAWRAGEDPSDYRVSS